MSRKLTSHKLASRKLVSVVFAASLLVASGAFAHDPEPRHGGRIEHAGNYHVELVAKGKTVEAHLLGHDNKPVKAEGFKGLAILVIGGKSERIALNPSQDGSKLVGDAPADLPASPRGVVQITIPGGTAASARFN